MYLQTVAIVDRFIGLARGKIEKSCNFFIEQNITCRIQNMRIDPKRTLTDVAASFSGFSSFVQGIRFISSVPCDDFTIPKLEANVFEWNPLGDY
jgi:hypothetical protein